MKLKKVQFATILFGLEKMIKRTSRKYPAFAERLKEHNLTAQIKIVDDSAGRYFIFEDGRVRSKTGVHPNPDICMSFANAEVGVELLMPPRDQLSTGRCLREGALERGPRWAVPNRQLAPRD